MVKAGLINQPKLGVCEITQSGRETLASGELINNDYLSLFDTFNNFCSVNNSQLSDIAQGVG
ncbi:MULTISPECIES: winged helix-turn-helix domain-containing protein [Shewanella]|uniref:winged helix-turn-helix domain-containing protein n=1 Tax=Shewanella TaxID=22 RepID=UPI002119F4A4|nr:MULTISPECIES: winged helix-turn-helix domain-containing protein [Shewanella]